MIGGGPKRGARPGEVAEAIAWTVVVYLALRNRRRHMTPADEFYAAFGRAFLRSGR